MANRQAVEWICVCSDDSAGRVERDDVAVLRQDIGVPCLTEPDDIAAWLKQKHPGLTVVFTTYQSGEALSQAARAARFRFDLGIFDEAHKTVSDGGKLFSHLLHDANLPIRRRLFMTATERRYAGQSDTVLSMENPATYGETFHLLSFKRAMEYAPPILCDYKIISIAVSREEVAELIRENVFVRPDTGRWNKEIEADMLASLIALRKAMQKYPIRHAVSFHGSIQRAELFQTHNDAFSRAFPAYSRLETFHVSGQTPTGTRARVIKEFANTERGLITNARCLTEGVDVPGIDCVLFADPRRSAVDIVQAVGRALRPAPGKQSGYVIVPILHDADATPDDIFESDSFQEVLTTLRALAANDDRIIEYFRAVSQGRQRTGRGRVEFDMDERLAQRIDLAQFVRDIELKCWDRLEGLLATRVTIQQILQWADAHRQKTSQWPNTKSGGVLDAPGEKWRNIDKLLREGLRGLPGASSLAQLLAEKRGVRNQRTPPDLTVDQILEWADAHHRRTGSWPIVKSGGVKGVPGEKWANIDAALSQGRRTLPAGSSLAQLLAERRQVKNQQNLPVLTAGQVLKWADAHRDSTGQWPNENSGAVLDAPGEMWATIDGALSKGRRGLPGGSSLARLLAERRGVRNQKALPSLTVDQILKWVDAHFHETGAWPNRKSGSVKRVPGEKWANIDAALSQGRRTLPTGSSLAQLLAERRQVKNQQNLPALTADQILKWADAHHLRTGNWPKVLSGKVLDAPSEKWESIHLALYQGFRGLPGGSSLARLLAERRGVRNQKALPSLTVDQILKWADAHRDSTGQWPNENSGDVVDAPGEKWGNINAALANGSRGLSSGSSLPRLLQLQRGARNKKALSVLALDQILKWADAHHQETGKWPTRKSGEVKVATGEKWANIDSALCQGLRGLPHGSSLARLLLEERA